MPRSKPTPALTHDDVGFLRDLKVLSEHNGARQPEHDALTELFNRACTERGLEPRTIELAVEALC